MFKKTRQRYKYTIMGDWLSIYLNRQQEIKPLHVWTGAYDKLL